MSDMAVAEEACLAAEDRAPAIPQSRLAVALIELALAVGSFGIGTGEFAIMGLLPNVAQEFNVTTPEAGYAISAYALGVVVGAPIIAVLAAKLARQTLLLLLMAVFAVGNAVSAVAPTFESFVLLRFLTGLPHGAYFRTSAPRLWPASCWA
jgi:DHA1 family inner membrane transport protein